MQDYQQELVAIKDLLRNKPSGMSVTDISKALGKNKNTIGRYLDILLISGQVDMRTFGMAKVYTLSQRVPLSAMLGYSKEPIMVLDEENRIIDINDNFLQILQLPRSETLGKNISYLETPEIDVHELLENLTPKEDRQEKTVTFRIKNRGERIFHQKCLPTVFDDGKKGLTLILEDVTEHILAERKIHESEERFRMMADNIQDGLMILQDGKTIYTNNRIAEISGYSLEELWAMEPLAIIAPESREQMTQVIRALEAEPDKPGNFQTWIIRKDGKQRFISFRISGVRYRDSFLNFVIFTDVTSLKIQEAKVSESERRLRVMADNIQDGLVIVEDDRIVFSNRRIKEITGYSMEEMAAMCLNGTLLTEDTRHLVESGIVPVTGKKEIDEIFKTVSPDSDTPGEFKIWIRRKDGVFRYLHGKITAAKNNELTTYYITIADITSFAEREKILRERIDALQDLLH